MTPTIREFRQDDADAVAAVLRAVSPYVVTTSKIVAAQAANSPARQQFRLFVAEEGGQVLGSVSAGLFLKSADPGRAFASLGVHPAHRNRGAGAALLTAAERYLAGIGAISVNISAQDDGHSPAFAEHRGYERGRAAYYQRLDLTTAQLPALSTPKGIELHTAADFAADPRPLYETDVEISADVPSAVSAEPISYNDWLTLYWDRQDLDRDLSSVAVVNGEVATYIVARTDGESRYWSGMTGTRRFYRGLGLAKLAKNDSLHRARAAGYREAFTSNDDTNAPMLAINTWFGYEPVLTEWRYTRALA